MKLLLNFFKKITAKVEPDKLPAPAEAVAQVPIPETNELIRAMAARIEAKPDEWTVTGLLCSEFNYYTVKATLTHAISGLTIDFLHTGHENTRTFIIYTVPEITLTKEEKYILGAALNQFVVLPARLAQEAQDKENLKRKLRPIYEHFFKNS